MAEGGYSISNIYQGGYSSLSPKYGDVFTGYRVNPGSIGITTDPRTANVIQDASTKLATGAKQIELALVSPEIFDSIPKQQLKEINRLSKLTGVNVSVHAPVVDSSGITQQGFSEVNRELAERKIADALIRSHEVNPEGNSPVTFHSAEGLQGSEWKTLGEKGKEREAKRFIAVDRDTGKMMMAGEEKLYHPSTYNEKGELIPVSEKGEIMTPEESLKSTNTTDWDNKLSQLFFNKERADEILQQNQPLIKEVAEYLQEAEKKGERPILNPTQEQVYLKAIDAQNYLSDIRKHANAIFSKAYEFGTEEQRKKLKKISEEYVENIKEKDMVGVSRAMGIMLNQLKSPDMVPEIYAPIEQFAIEKSSKTFGNAAFDAYKKFGDKAPILSIENPPVGFAISTGEDLKNLVEASRKQFVERVVEEKKIKKKEAEKLAERFIGATWDVGHINMLRKQGFGKEAIIKETEKIAPFVKHVHLSDNFGFEHTELPMGMGNVPIKEIMNKLGKEGFNAKKIIEAGQWWQHFRTAPFKETLEAFGSPFYGGQAPYWNQNIGLQQGYYTGLAGQWLPQTHYETFGTSFARLPMELGGQQGDGQGSRMSGRPME